MHSKKSINRRTFLRSAALSAAGLAIVPRLTSIAAASTSPNEKLNIAVVGIGGMGQVNLRNLETENIVALCDVDEAYAAPVFDRYPRARRYRDFRVMLDEGNAIDAVLIATPDHTHADITIAAMQAGKHVYCEKPLSNTFAEARRMKEVARETGVITQMGNQGRSGAGARRVCEWIWAGAIGKIREVDVWCSLSYYPWGHAGWSTTHPRKPSETPPVPDTLDWDLWLGPAPERAYHPCYHPGRWRAWWDFGSGMMGDRGCHTLDPVLWALKLDQPTAVEGSVSDFNEDTHPVAARVSYDFPARGDMPPVKLHWLEGLTPPRPDGLEPGRPLGHSEGGALFKGEDGMIMCGVYGDSPRFVSRQQMREFHDLEETIPRVEGSHQQEWVRAIKEGRKAVSDFSVSGPLTEVALLGNVAKRMQKKMDWDGEQMRFPNDERANSYLERSEQ